jgi:hypothetical protein
MGHLDKPALGKLRGKAGNIVGRDFGYDRFISVRPKKYKVKKEISEVSSKQSFQASVQMARAVVNFPALKEVWNKCNMPGKRGYNRIISANQKLLKNCLPTTDNIITPKGKALLFDILRSDNTQLKCSFGMAGAIRPPFRFYYIFVFSNPKEEGSELYFINGYFFEIKPEYADECRDKKEPGKYIVNIPCRILRDNIKRFRNVILYNAVVGTATIKNRKWWTSTVATDITNLYT